MKPKDKQKMRYINETQKKLDSIRYANKIRIGKMMGDVPKKKCDTKKGKQKEIVF